MIKIIILLFYSTEFKEYKILVYVSIFLVITDFNYNRFYISKG